MWGIAGYILFFFGSFLFSLLTSVSVGRSALPKSTCSMSPEEMPPLPTDRELTSALIPLDIALQQSQEVYD